MSAHEFTITVTDLDAGGKQYRFPVRPAWIRGALEGHEATAGKREGMLEVRASKSGHDVVVHGKLDAELEIPCARCLEPFSLAVHSDVSVLYVPRGVLRAEAGVGKERGVDDAEADAFPFDGETVVLDDLVRDELVLEVPMIPLCSEACPGISPPASEGTAGDGGRDEAGSSSPQPAQRPRASSPRAAQRPRSPEAKDIDPRLAPLLRFKNKDKKE